MAYDGIHMSDSCNLHHFQGWYASEYCFLCLCPPVTYYVFLQKTNKKIT